MTTGEAITDGLVAPVPRSRRAGFGLGGRKAEQFVAGIGDQVISSATNFGLSVLAARLLGASGLGLVMIGFSAYLVALGLLRALISEPLVAVTAPRSSEERRVAARMGLKRVLVLGLAMTFVFGAGGRTIPGVVGRGMWAFAPWILPLLLQDYWRSMLFRDRRPWAACANDGAWALGMAASVAIAVAHPTPGSVVAVWGIGAACGALLGFRQVSLRGAMPTEKSDWRFQTSGLGTWLGITSLVYNSAYYGMAVIVGVLLSAKSLGGLRAVSSLFAPLTLFAPALSLPGLPMIARARSISEAKVQRLVLALSGGAVALTTGYLLVASLAGRLLLSSVFGHGFSGLTFLIVPVGLTEVATATSLGAFIDLKAQGQGKRILGSRIVWMVVSLCGTYFGALHWGVRGAAWAAFVAAAATSGVVLFTHARLSGSATVRSSMREVR